MATHSSTLAWKIPWISQFSSVQSLSRVRLLATPWTAAYQAPPSMGFSKQEYWSEVPLPSPSERAKNCQMTFKNKIRRAIFFNEITIMSIQ